jgi:hypothetical protein
MRLRQSEICARNNKEIVEALEQDLDNKEKITDTMASELHRLRSRLNSFENKEATFIEEREFLQKSIAQKNNELLR